jgi:DNA polymerase-1
LLNTPVQGTAADGMKAGQVLLYNALKKYGSKAKIVNVIHDEFVVEVVNELKEEVRALQGECMRKGMSVYVKDVPVVVEGGIGTSWAEK